MRRGETHKQDLEQGRAKLQTTTHTCTACQNVTLCVRVSPNVSKILQSFPAQAGEMDCCAPTTDENGRPSGIQIKHVHEMQFPMNVVKVAVIKSGSADQLLDPCVCMCAVVGDM